MITWSAFYWQNTNKNNDWKISSYAKSSKESFTLTVQYPGTPVHYFKLILTQLNVIGEDGRQKSVHKCIFCISELR